MSLRRSWNLSIERGDINTSGQHRSVGPNWTTLVYAYNGNFGAKDNSRRQTLAGMALFPSDLAWHSRKIEMMLIFFFGLFRFFSSFSSLSFSRRAT